MVMVYDPLNRNILVSRVGPGDGDEEKIPNSDENKFLVIQFTDSLFTGSTIPIYLNSRLISYQIGGNDQENCSRIVQ
jgi:hypothetical protein